MTAEQLIEDLKKIPKDTTIKVAFDKNDFEYEVSSTKYYKDSSIGGWVFSKVFVLYVQE